MEVGIVTGRRIRIVGRQQIAAKDLVCGIEHRRARRIHGKGCSGLDRHAAGQAPDRTRRGTVGQLQDSLQNAGAAGEGVHTGEFQRSGARLQQTGAAGERKIDRRGDAACNGCRCEGRVAGERKRVDPRRGDNQRRIRLEIEAANCDRSARDIHFHGAGLPGEDWRSPLCPATVVGAGIIGPAEVGAQHRPRAVAAEACRRRGLARIPVGPRHDRRIDIEINEAAARSDIDAVAQTGLDNRELVVVRIGPARILDQQVRAIGKHVTANRANIEIDDRRRIRCDRCDVEKRVWAGSVELVGFQVNNQSGFVLQRCSAIDRQCFTKSIFKCAIGLDGERRTGGILENTLAGKRAVVRIRQARAAVNGRLTAEMPSGQIKCAAGNTRDTQKAVRIAGIMGKAGLLQDRALPCICAADQRTEIEEGEIRCRVIEDQARPRAFKHDRGKLQEARLGSRIRAQRAEGKRCGAGTTRGQNRCTRCRRTDIAASATGHNQRAGARVQPCLVETDLQLVAHQRAGQVDDRILVDPGITVEAGRIAGEGERAGTAHVDIADLAGTRDIIGKGACTNGFDREDEPDIVAEHDITGNGTIERARGAAELERAGRNQRVIIIGIVCDQDQRSIAGLLHAVRACEHDANLGGAGINLDHRRRAILVEDEFQTVGGCRRGVGQNVAVDIEDQSRHLNGRRA